MERYLEAKADHGVDTLLKVVGVLRRKEFMVKDVKMSSSVESRFSELIIHLNQETENTMELAKAHLEKVIGLRDIVLKEEI